MNVAVTFVTATAVVGLVTPPTRRYLHWAGTACLLMLICAVALGILSALLVAAGDWNTPVVTLTIALTILFPAHWLSRSPEHPEAKAEDDVHEDPEDDSGGGGGGPPTPPEDPRPGPPAPGLDWDRFDDLRESWTRPEPPRELDRERELELV